MRNGYSIKHLLLGSVIVLSILILFWNHNLIFTSLHLKPQVASRAYIRRQKVNSTDALLYLKSLELESTKTINHFKYEGDANNNNYRHIPVTLPHGRFHDRTLNTCDNNHNKCLQKGIDGCWAIDIPGWFKIFESGTLHGVPLYSDTEYVFPWELRYLKTPPLIDLNSLPDLMLSKINYLSGGSILWLNRTTTAVLSVKNEPVIFRLDLVDGYGRSRTTGGDEIRVWLTGYAPHSAKESFSVSGQVRDLNNGSFLFTVTPHWTGTAQLNVAVTYPREYIRLTVHHYRIGSHRFIFGMFRRGNVQEVTLCHSTPNVPGRPCVCNMTELNSGVPYYCGRPFDDRLSCDDWYMVNTVPRPGFKNMTPAEISLEENIARPPQKSTIKHNIDIRISEDGTDPILPTCYSSSRRKSWTKKSPRGMWSNDKTIWTSFVCQEPRLTTKWALNCLRSTQVWMIGDSNIRHMAQFVAKMIGCEKLSGRWPASGYCRDDNNNTTIHFRPHEYPLYVQKIWFRLMNNGAVTDTLFSIPSTGDHIVVIHYFLHFSSSHLSVLFQRLSGLKTAISRLISRNPRVLVGIRGPHTSAVEWNVNHAFGGDVLGSYIREMYMEVFQDLQDHVVFLDGWDMSISFENEAFHPPGDFTRALWRTLLSYICT